MKLFTTVCLAVIICLCANCGKKQCTDALDITFCFLNASYADSVTDTVATIGRYSKGKNFATFIDTITPNIMDRYPSAPLFRFMMPGASFYNYDYLITLFPSNRQYKLRGLARHQGSMNWPIGMEPQSCINGFSFTLNDSAYVINQESYSVSIYVEY